MFFGAVGEKAEVTDAHETIGQDVEQEAADEFFGIESLRFQPIFISLKAKSGLDPIFDPIFPILTPFLTPFSISHLWITTAIHLDTPYCKT